MRAVHHEKGGNRCLAKNSTARHKIHRVLIQVKLVGRRKKGKSSDISQVNTKMVWPWSESVSRLMILLFRHLHQEINHVSAYNSIIVSCYYRSNLLPEQLLSRLIIIALLVSEIRNFGHDNTTTKPGWYQSDRIFNTRLTT